MCSLQCMSHFDLRLLHCRKSWMWCCSGYGAGAKFWLIGYIYCYSVSLSEHLYLCMDDNLDKETKTGTGLCHGHTFKPQGIGNNQQVIQEIAIQSRGVTLLPRRLTERKKWQDGEWMVAHSSELSFIHLFVFHYSNLRTEC